MKLCVIKKMLSEPLPYSITGYELKINNNYHFTIDNVYNLNYLC